MNRAAERAISTTAQAAVFLDPSGRRWRRVCLTLTPILVAALVFFGYAAYRLLTPPQQTDRQAGISVADLGLRPGQELSVVGVGPMLRVIEVAKSGEQTVGVEPFTGETVALTPDEVAAAGDAKYVIQKYGYGQASKTISLTFDDGPHPVHTPKLLDILSHENVPATFFVTGSAAAHHPEIVEREAREGHSVANHSLTHADVNDVGSWRARAEFVLTDRVLRSLTGESTTSFRLPYGGEDPVEVSHNTLGILRAQQLGYHLSSYDFETLDWSYASAEGHGHASEIPLPEFDGRNITVLMHDGGAENREATMAYVKDRLIPAARAAGYTFTTMPQTQPVLAGAIGPAEPSFWDETGLVLAKVALVWPNRIIHLLFAFAVAMVGVVGLTNVALAVARRRSQPRFPERLPVVPVSIVIAAYNEEKVIGRTLDTLLASTYPFVELIVVNDGSTDRTASEIETMSLHDPRIRLVDQQNSGKWAALNNGTAQARGEIIVTLDADTIFTPETVGNLVRQFLVDEDGRLGAVAGVVHVGNRGRNLLTRWQALEYLTQIGIERSAYAQLGSVPIIPGACAAWRKTAVLQAGGYSNSTLAEDCDLTLALHQHGWRVSQDDEALAFTEAPDHADALLAQRVRWTFGTLQAISKHRNMLFRRRYGWLGMAVLPYMMASVLLPIVFLPFVTTMLVMTVRNEGWWMVGMYFLAFTAVHWLITAVAVVLMRERWGHLLIVPIYRVVYEPLRAYLLYTSAYLAMRGVKLGWNKLQRTGVLDKTLAPAEIRIPRQLPREATSAPLQEAAK